MSRLTTRQLFSLSLLSGAGLCLEITLTRLLSVLYYPQVVFVVLSFAILGIGLGAAIAALRPTLRADHLIPYYMALAGIFSLVLILAHNLQTILFILLVLPFVCIGLTFASLFSHSAGDSARLYMADLIGAGLGAILVIPLLNLFGALNAVLFIAVLFGFASLLYTLSQRWIQIILFAITSLVFITNLFIGFITVDMASIQTDKPIKTVLADGARVIATRWDSFARTDVVQPTNGGPYQMYADGAAGSIMPPAVGGDILFRDIGFFPFATDRPQRVMVIGPGAGLDIWFGLQSGAQEIIGVEVNPASVDLVNALSEYNGNLYDHPEVHILVDEGRSALRRDDSQYDLIFLSQVVTLSAERDGLALVENSVYTVEAFQDYFAHLTPNGQIALKLYDEATLTRALSVVMTTLMEQGLSDSEAIQYVAAILDPSENIPLLLVKNEPFSSDDVLVLGAIANDIGFRPLFLPGVFAQPPLDEVEQGATTFSEIIERSETDISPTTDNRPYFFQFEPGIPTDLQTPLAILAAAIIFGGIVLFTRSRGTSPTRLKWTPLYFAGLGVAFFAVEIAIIQQTRLLLGHPTTAIAAVLSVLLIGGGIGSILTRKLPEYIQRWLPLLIAVGLVIWLFIWPPISDQFVGAPGAVRILILVVLLGPLAVLMGMPFPIGLHTLRHDATHHVALAWAVNGFMTVFGSMASVAISAVLGFKAVLILGIAIYGLTFIVARIIVIDTT
jgi:hypothetical protein